MPSSPGVINYPTALDDAISLIQAENQASSTLTSGITATTLLIPVADPGEFPSSGLATLTDSITPWVSAPTKIEIFRYTSKSGSNLVVPSTGDRGIYGTTAQSWITGNFVGQRMTARHHTVLADALIAAQTKIGIGADTPGGSGEALLSDSSGASVWRAIAQADVSGLVSALSGKASTSHTHLKADITNFANDTITLSGDLSGSGTTAISATIANNAVTYAKLQDVSATQRVIGRNTSGSGDAEEVTASQLLDWIGTTRGSVLYRGASGWSILTPGTSGDVLTSNGAGADPSYQTPSGGGGGGANTALSNLAAVAINTSLVSDTDNTDDLGASATRWKNLYLSGFVRISGTATDTFTTPGSASVPTKINIPVFDPGNFAQIMAMGIADIDPNRRVASFFDARTVAHQPTLAIFCPNENNLFGPSWEGSNTEVTLKTTITRGVVRVNDGTNPAQLVIAPAATASAAFLHVRADVNTIPPFQVDSAGTPTIDWARFTNNGTTTAGSYTGVAKGGTIFTPRNVVTGTGTQNLDFSLGNVQQFTFGAGNATFTFSNIPNSANLTIVIIQDGTGGRTLTWPATAKFIGGTPPTLSAGAGARDVIRFYSDGTNIYQSSPAALAVA